MIRGVTTLSPNRSRSTPRKSPMASTKPSSSAARPVQYSPENKSFSGPCQLGAAARFDQRDKVFVNFSLQFLQPFDVVGILRQERIEHRLVVARRIEPPLDADLRDQLVEAERAADHADRADDRMRIGDDLVGRRRRSCSRPTRRHPRRRRSTWRLCSSASSRMRRKIRCDCTGDPPGELMDERDRRGVAAWRRRDRACGRCRPSDRPGRSGVENPMMPVKPHHRHHRPIAAKTLRNQRAQRAAYAAEKVRNALSGPRLGHKAQIRVLQLSLK